MAKNNKRKLLEISENSLLVTDRGVVKILRLHRKGKNEKMENIVLFQIGCDVWIVERMLYQLTNNLTNRPTDQPTNRLTNGQSQL